MDLLLDKDAFTQASRELKTKCEELRTLKSNIKNSFEQLKKDWDSDAGRQFFAKFEDSLIVNLEKYSTVFEYMSRNLSTASQKYDEVFRAADAVASVQY
jgi:WXG100 family type VII secretion target